MPIYEFKCSKCGHIFSELRNFEDNSKAFCPKCNGESYKIFSKSVGISFRGQGFYITDYKKKNIEVKDSKKE
uniref:Zinc ribbon domain-containing protein n=1 Tax=candidate division WOR-3 bacterium TaxID=2052148 RepID=A0A7C4Y6C8_UNCW3